jgi:hypothetical protein
MIKLFLNKTDEFLCKNVKGIFEKAESAYKSKGLEVDLVQELRNLELNPLVCAAGRNSKFEKNIKIKIRMILGIFFVAIPLFGFALVTYIFNIDYLFAFISTFVVAMLVSYRMDEIAKRYAQRRFLFA